MPQKITPITREDAEALYLIGGKFWVRREQWSRWCENAPHCYIFTTVGFERQEPYVVANATGCSGHHPGGCRFPEEFEDCAVVEESDDEG